MSLKITSCTATPSSINLAFSDALDEVAAAKKSNYAISQVGRSTPALEFNDVRYERALRMVIGTLSANVPRGAWVTIVVDKTQVNSATGTPFTTDGNTIAVQINGEAVDHTASSVEDAITYPVLTEEIGYSSSTSARGLGGGATTAAAPLGQMVSKTLGDVLGWKIRDDDPKGFLGALTASFAGTDVDGRTEWSWTPRTYAVQTDLSGGISGAQASIYTRAQVALDKSLPLLDGIYALDTEADPDDVTALKALARSQLTQLVNEFPRPGGPRVSRVNQYFGMLLTDPAAFPPATLDTEPDEIAGSLGRLRDILGLKLSDGRVNTVEEEQNLTNFRILSDYVTSLAQTWINNQDFFGLESTKPFFGTQLVLLSRQLSVIAESVDNVKFALDSVFIGPAERQTIRLKFGHNRKRLFAEDLFSWIHAFAVDEGSSIIQQGGKLSILGNFLPIARELHAMVAAVDDRHHHNDALPRGFHTARVQRALQELGKQLKELVDLAEPLARDIEEEPPAKDLERAVRVADEVQSRDGTPYLIVIPQTLDFGTVGGSSISTQTITVVNLSSQIEYFSVTATVDRTDNVFAVSPLQLPGPLKPMQQGTVAVSFAESGTERVGATLTVTATYNDATNKPQSVSQTVGLSGGAGAQIRRKS